MHLRSSRSMSYIMLWHPSPSSRQCPPVSTHVDPAAFSWHMSLHVVPVHVQKGTPPRLWPSGAAPLPDQGGRMPLTCSTLKPLQSVSPIIAAHGSVPVEPCKNP